MNTYYFNLNVFLILMSLKFNLFEGQCNNVLIPTNAKTTGDCVSTTQKHIKIGSICTIICNNGCVLSDGTNTTQLYCINNNGILSWDKSVPESCYKQESCDPIGSIQFGSSCDSTSIGQTCVLTCDSGYALSGSSSSLTCVDKSIPNLNVCTKPYWSPSITSLPVCILIQCPNILNSIEGKTRGDCINATEGQVCTLICENGYYNNINNDKEVSVKCQSNSQWERFPQCIRRTCPHLKEPLNGKFTLNTCAPGFAGLSCDFTCNNGFILQPPERTKLLCQNNGNWTENGVEPTCILMQCPNIVNLIIENGGIITMEGCFPHTIGSTCRFFCNDNYNLIGYRSTTCLQNGEWSPNDVPPTCLLITCPDLTPIESGSFEGFCTPGQKGQKCTYRCNDGYGLVGDSVFQCLPTGQWDKIQTPSCMEIIIMCRSLKSIEFAKLEGDCNATKPEHKCLVKCFDGKMFDLQCGYDGLWNGDPICDQTQCPAIYPNSNTNISGSCAPGVIGQSCVFNCAAGSVRVPQHTSILCTADGWDKEPPQCFAYIPCPNIADPENGQTSGECAPGIASLICSFTCSDGFEIEGQSELMCNNEGVWSDKPPVCKRILCQRLSPPPGVIMSGSCSPGLSGMSCVFSCPSVLYLSGPKRITCQSDGSWDEDINQVKCQSKPANFCPKLRIPVGGKPNKYCSPGRIGRKCKIECKKGYKMSGYSMAECKPGGRWIGSIGTCLKQCPPIRITNGRTTGQCSPTGLEGKSCRVTCNQNYRLVGSRKTTCTSNGFWSPSIQRCIRNTRGLPLSRT